MLLSIDVGIRNLAMCCMIPSDRRIIHWEVSGVPSEREGGLFPALAEHLARREWLSGVTEVVIERQPDRNKRMKAVEHFLHGFFTGSKKRVIIFDAKHKIPDVVGPGRAQYTKRKNTAISRARDFISGDEVNASWLNEFNGHKKKDDLADTVMQALAYLTMEVEAPRTPVAKKIVARKPTPNQRDTKYSKSNLLWLWKNQNQEVLKKDKRFTKDIKRYFHSLTEFLGLIE